MHSRIFQLSTERIDKDEYLCSSHYESYEDIFIGAVADYVADSEDREEDIKWIGDSYKDIKVSHNHVDDTMFTFKKGFAKKYFKDRYKEFKDISSKMTFEDFAGITDTTGMSVYRVKQCMENTWGFYIYSSDFGTISLDRFIREHMEEGKPYFVGGTVDYHS